jgi:hypothetical protein
VVHCGYDGVCVVYLSVRAYTCVFANWRVEPVSTSVKRGEQKIRARNVDSPVRLVLSVLPVGDVRVTTHWLHGPPFGSTLREHYPIAAPPESSIGAAIARVAS